MKPDISTVSGLNILRMSAEQASTAGSPIKSMREGNLDIILVSNLFSTAECQAICGQLQLNELGMIKTYFPDIMNSYFLGVNLNLADPSLYFYFDEAIRFNKQVNELLASVGGLQRRILNLLSVLYGGRPFSAAPGPTCRTEHMITTFRCHLEGGFIPTHFDNEQESRTSYRYLTPMTVGNLFSFVTVFSSPLAGGMLQIFNHRRGSRMYRMNGGLDDAQHIETSDMPSLLFTIEPGSMLIFNSGELLHRLTPIQGNKPRWTACSFMSESVDSNHVYLWG